MTDLCWLVRSERDVPDGEGWLSPDERRVLARLRFEPRRRDWRLGRWTAKSVLRRLPDSLLAGLLPNAISILADEDGAPIVSRFGIAHPVALSLSHREGCALAVAGPAGVALGCDLELVEPRSPEFVEDWFTRDERHLLERARPGERDRLANLLWSAKESALKALRTGLRADTRSVEVRPSPRAGTAGWRPLSVHRSGAPPLAGWWRPYGPFVLTVAAEPASGPPVRLVNPSRPGLAPREPARLA